jgi:hypothetical protein
MVRTMTSEDPIVNIPEGSAERGSGQAPRGSGPPHPSVSLEQLLAAK